MDLYNLEVDKKKFCLSVIFFLFIFFTAYVIYEVLYSMLFAFSLVYILYPLQKRLKNIGFSKRQSSFILTFLAFISMSFLITPFIIFLYRRYEILLNFIRNLPQEFTFDLVGVNYTIQTSQIVSSLQIWISNFTISLVRDIPTITFKFILILFIIYVVLLRPNIIKKSIYIISPDFLDDIFYSYHDRVRETLYGIYVVQAMTAFLTFIVALPIFYFLGYEPFFSLSVLSGILQFIPILGPSIIIVSLVLFDLIVNNITRAILLFISGILVIGFLPDVVIRLKLADRFTGLSSSLYFIGFIGGVLTLGLIGLILGPLIIALVLETIELLSEK